MLNLAILETKALPFCEKYYNNVIKIKMQVVENFKNGILFVIFFDIVRDDGYM